MIQEINAYIFWLLRFIAYQFSLALTYGVVTNWGAILDADRISAVRFVSYLLLIGSITFCLLLVPAYLFVRRLLPVRLRRTDWLSDAFVVLVSILVFTVWIFVNPSANYSFGDSHGLIVDSGQITPYGWIVKTNNWLACMGAAALYFILVIAASIAVNRWNKQS